MITINLLPTNLRNHILKTRFIFLFYQFLLNILVFAMLLALIFIALVVSKQFYYNNLIATESEKLIEYTRPSLQKANKIASYITANKLIISELETHQKNYFKLTTFWGDFAQIIPSGIKITYIELDIVSKAVVIKGSASSRKDLINFADKINNSNVFSAIISTTQFARYQKNENINFELRDGITLKRD